MSNNKRSTTTSSPTDHSPDEAATAPESTPDPGQRYYDEPTELRPDGRPRTMNTLNGNTQENH